MKPELRNIVDLVLFVKIVQTGGISNCAKELGMNRTTVSKRLNDLETELGVSLLDRSPKYTIVTDAGRRCYEHCQDLLEIAGSAGSIVTKGHAQTIRRPIVVGAPPDIVHLFLRDNLVEFENENPTIPTSLHPLSRITKESLETVDIAIGWSRPSDARIISKKVAGVSQSVYASPEYLAENGIPEKPKDLAGHRCIVDEPVAGKLVWSFWNRRDKSTISIKRHIEVNGILDAVASAIAGLGLCRLPTYACARHVEEGRLTLVLSEYDLADRPLLLVIPKSGNAQIGSAVLRIFLEDKFRNSPF